jgi:hypothetical protein
MNEDKQQLLGRLSVMVPMEMIDAIEDWRRRQPRIPSLAAAVRTLLAHSLETMPGIREAQPIASKRPGRRGNHK